jgi:hypothetical protein
MSQLTLSLEAKRAATGEAIGDPHVERQIHHSAYRHAASCAQVISRIALWLPEPAKNNVKPPSVATIWRLVTAAILWVKVVSNPADANKTNPLRTRLLRKLPPGTAVACAGGVTTTAGAAIRRA